MQEPFKILFYEENRNPIDYRCIRRFVYAFPKSYHEVVGKIIENSRRLSPDAFKYNVALLMPSFRMTRVGAFHRIRVDKEDQPHDPNGVIDHCWKVIGKELQNIKAYLEEAHGVRNRVLADLSQASASNVIEMVSESFVKLCGIDVKAGRISPVGASKVLFAVLPEIALPVDNAEWKHVFKTKDYGKVLTKMTNEIIEWRDRTGKKLEDIDSKLTWPAVYNVMAMAARP